MSDEILTETGRLQDKLLPAVYFDSSVVIDYWMTEGLEETKIEEEWSSLSKYRRFVREILRTDIRLKKVLEIRQRLVYGKTKVTAVISPLCLLELIEWYAESGFKQAAAEASNVIFIQKKSKKEIGDYLKKVTELWKSKTKAEKGLKTNNAFQSIESDVLEMFISETALNDSFAVSHGLQGLLEVNVSNFNMPTPVAKPKLYAYAYLQVGTADIMHILIAQHLGCSYFASFDEDFKRVRDIIKKEAGMTLLSSPEEILAVL